MNAYRRDHGQIAFPLWGLSRIYRAAQRPFFCSSLDKQGNRIASTIAEQNHAQASLCERCTLKTHEALEHPSHLPLYSPTDVSFFSSFTLAQAGQTTNFSFVYLPVLKSSLKRVPTNLLARNMSTPNFIALPRMLTLAARSGFTNAARSRSE